MARSKRAFALGVVSSSLLVACSSTSSDVVGVAGLATTAGASPLGGASNNGGAGSTGMAGSGLGGEPGTAGSSALGGSSNAGASAVDSGGTPAGGSGAMAGMAGAASGSSGSAGGSSIGCPTGAAFCDSFDASTSLASAWTVDNTLGATVKVVSAFTVTPGPTAAHSGANAVQISFMTGAGYAMIVSKMGFPSAPAAAGYWARAWLYVETPPTDMGHDVYIEGSTAMDLKNAGARPLNTQGGKMEINVDPVNGGESSAASAMAIPRGAWTCFEWQISATGGTGDVSLYLGGGATPTASLKAKPIQALVEQRIGYERYAAGTAGNLWIDDYAIGPTRLGCL